MTLRDPGLDDPVIVIIEREDMLMDLLRVLSAYRLSISGTTTVAEGAKLLDQIQPDLVVIDPTIEEGFALLDGICSREQHVKIVALTDSDEVAGRVRRMGIERVVVKSEGTATVVDALVFFLGDQVIPHYQANGIRVLLVDGESDVRNMLSEFLALRGYTVVTATTGQEALVLVARDPGISVVVLDLMLPGMGGLETLRELMDGRSRPSVIMTSAVADREIARHAQHLGALDYLLKPLDPEVLEVSIVACVAEAEYRNRPWLERLLPGRGRPWDDRRKEKR